MKRFNLEEAKKGKPFQTKDGHKCRLLADDLNSTYPLVVAVDYSSIELVYSYTKEGLVADGQQNDSDLYMSPEAQEYYINVYTDNGGVRYSGTVLYDGYEEAVEAADNNGRYVATAKIRWEE